MSVLLLDERRSDFDFQKQNNTFAKRHHLRIWRRQDTFQERPVWFAPLPTISASNFPRRTALSSTSSTRRSTVERAKVVSDLLFTGRVQSLALVERPKVPRTSRNATGDAIETDGRMAVLVLK